MNPGWVCSTGETRGAFRLVLVPPRKCLSLVRKIRTGQKNPPEKAGSVPASSSPAAALPFPPWSTSLPSFQRFPSSQRTPNPNPLPAGVGGAGGCPRSSGTAFPGEGNCRQMLGAQLWEGLRVKQDLPLELLAPDPTEPRHSPGCPRRAGMSLGTWGRCWSQFLAEPECHSRDLSPTPSIPKNSMASHILGKVDASPIPSRHPRPLHQSLWHPGSHRRDIPAGIQLRESQRARVQMGKQLWVPSPNSPLF